jgi:two-component system sensor histidine kinase RegB
MKSPAARQSAHAEPPTGPEMRRIQPRTLALIRWFAIAGQAGALLIVNYGLGFDLPIQQAMATVALSVLVNATLAIRRRAGNPPGPNAAVGYLAFDIVQLTMLLYLTGGLENPFAFLLLAPVAVSATVLPAVSTGALSALVFACISLLAFWHQPLPWKGPPPDLPLVYVVGVWIALSVGVLFFALYTWRVADEARRLADGLSATHLALAREQQLSAVGALAAAAAHELGSPLGTIAVVVREMAREVTEDDPLAEDVQLLREQTERCRAILAEISQRPAERMDEPFATVPAHAVVEAAAKRHATDRINVAYDAAPEESAPDSAEPAMAPSPEIIHGLGNLIQNAIQFARKGVHIDIRWDDRVLNILIADDGPGFSQAALDRLGEPYMPRRGAPGDHMGLGVFIAQTLLKRTGAEIVFRNGKSGGAVVEVIWSRAALGDAPGANWGRQADRGNE